MVALGGSITAGQGVTVARDNYVERLYRWVQVCSEVEVPAYLGAGIALQGTGLTLRKCCTWEDKT